MAQQIRQDAESMSELQTVRLDVGKAETGYDRMKWETLPRRLNEVCIGRWAGKIWWPQTYDVPYAPGVYALYLNNRLIYIGQSRVLRNRLVSHYSAHRINKVMESMFNACPDGSNIDIKIRLAKPTENLSFLEGRLIRRLNPPGNIYKPWFSVLKITRRTKRYNKRHPHLDYVNA